MRQRIILFTVAVLYQVSAFSIFPTKVLHHGKCKLCSRNYLADENGPFITNLKIPLLRSDAFLPLPSSHLPDDLATLNVYSIPLETALDQSIVAYATENTDSYVGHVCTTPSTWIGAVGCVSQTIPRTDTAKSNPLVCKGAFRFVVKQVLQEIPFPIVLVDELVDQETSETAFSWSNEKEDASSDPIECTSRLLSLLDEYCQQQLENVGEVSPLEQVILEETGNVIMPMVVEQLAMEKAAVLQVFRAFYLDNERPGSSLPQILYATALLAAEIADFAGSQRQKLLEMTNSIERLVRTCNTVEEKVGMARARKMAGQITAAADEASKDLKIGQPQLPPWAKSIRKGTELEYYWNEEYDWCRGVVTEDPVRIVDEIILTVRFEDGETHRLPFSADEKIRWRPPSRLAE